MSMFSAFEDSAIYSFSWLYSISAYHIHSFFDIHNSMPFSYVITGLLSMIWGYWYALPDNSFITIIYIICVHVIAYFLMNVWYARDSVMRSASSLISSFVYYKIVVSYLGQTGTHYFPFILYTFYIILCGNLFGLIPGVFSITSNLSFTLYMSSVCWIGIFLMGINFHGIKFFNFFYPTMVPFAISPFLMFIEIISFIVRLASLSLRLFANIVAGHILIETVSAFFYHISITVNSSINIEYLLGSITLLCMVFVLIIFESLIAFLQAYIFAVLLTIYMNDVFAMHS